MGVKGHIDKVYHQCGYNFLKVFYNKGSKA